MNTILRNIILCIVKKHFPTSATGRKSTEPEILLDEMLYVLWSGCPWRALRSAHTCYQTVHRHFMLWSRKQIFAKAYKKAYALQNRPVRRNLRFHAIDTSFVKNIYGRDCVGRNPTDRGRAATKVSTIVDQNGMPVSFAFFKANRNDTQTVDATLQNLICKPSPATPLYADKGYDSKQVRATMRLHYIDRVAKRRTHVHRVVNRRRNIVERFFAWLDKSRRLLVRYDSYITSYEAWTWLASLRLLQI